MTKRTNSSKKIEHVIVEAFIGLTVVEQKNKIQTNLLKKLGGEIKVKTELGEIDLLTKDSLIEIRTLHEWMAGLGNLVVYSHCYPDKKKVLYLFNVNKEYDHIRTICDSQNIILKICK